MSYSVRARSLGDTATVEVGQRAYSDPVLARASLLAAKVIEKVAVAPEARRLEVMVSEVEKLGSGLGRQARSALRRQLRKGVPPDRALFDSIRVTLANRQMNEAVDRASVYAASRVGWSALVDSALGQLSPNDRMAACTATGATATVGGVAQVIPVYGTIVGGILQIGSGIASSALDCGREQREAQARLGQARAAQEAAEAQARLERAQLLAMSQEMSARRQRKRMLIVGGLVLGSVALVAALW